MKSKLSAALVAGWCVLTLSVGAANADTTFDVLATFASSGPGACPGCTLGGNIVIDTTTGSIISEFVTMTGQPDGPFDTNGGVSAVGGGVLHLVIRHDAQTDQLDLYLPVFNLVGYTGGSICGTVTLCGGIFSFVTNAPAVLNIASGSLTPAAVPGPIAGAGLPGLLGMLGLGGWQWRRRKKLA